MNAPLSKSSDDYLLGKKLYGDDFSKEEILQWFSEEKDGYFNLKGGKPYYYDYHELNIFHGLRFLRKQRFGNVLGIGSAYGEEFIPILNRIEKLTILESADGFFKDKINHLSVTYIKANPLGLLPFDDNSFDLITCLGVLHHIPNVSFVLKEVYRCLQRGGYFLIREPTTPGGDYNMARKGLTKKERGIPLIFFDNILKNCGFIIIKKRRCIFSLTRAVAYSLRIPVFNNQYFVSMDYLISKAFSFNKVYYAKHILQKIRPSAVYYLLTK